MMKLKNLLMTMLFAIGLSASAQEVQDPMIGLWKDGSSDRTFEVVQNSAGSYDAIIHKAENKDVIGKKQITNLKAVGNKKYDGGTIHLFSRNKTGKCSAELKDLKTLEIVGKVGFFSKSAIWKKLP
ncbi:MULTISPECIES: DUF2147 domain-containing protein [Mesonia]|nr:MULTISPECIES: DUF2147 domain-containing protein [Mesonia]MAN27568.1 hypothetical protein [Mesonia sp.]|tara:strand:+ start:4034 stop:4411 length:378 start_codon:yes stop_codon:yes gene_type:complete